MLVDLIEELLDRIVGPAWQQGFCRESSWPNVCKLITISVKKASPGREKTYRIVDIREQGRIFGSIPRRALAYSRAFALIRRSISLNRYFDRHLAKSEAPPCKPSTANISWPSSADRYYPIQTRDAFFARNSEKQKSRLRLSWPAFFK
jgi:hypothetical protein